jgi:acyl-CoA thioester hydrolase
MKARMSHYDFEVRIAYADTDRMGVVYYANYLIFFERGRTEFLRGIGLRYRDLEEKDKIYLPVMETQVQYLAPAQYDDLLRVRTVLSDMGGAHVIFRYEITQADSGTRVARGMTKHPVVNAHWRPTRLPPAVSQLLKKNLAK